MYAELAEIRNLRPTCGGSIAWANHAAACNRTDSRLTRALADRPLPSGYLMIPQ
jgi:hypothetical protein